MVKLDITETEAINARNAQAETDANEAAVFAYIKRYYMVNEIQISKALGLDPLTVLEALLSLEKKHENVITRNSVIGWIGDCD